MLNNQILTYDYLRLFNKDPKTQEIIGEVFAPVISIRITSGRKTSFPFSAMVDSGATRNLFPFAFGEQIGLNIRRGKMIKILGIGGKEIIAYTHKIKLFLGLKLFETEADFNFEENLPLLGRDGFFHLFQKIIFDEDFHQLQLVLRNES